jgi:CheY-like chemotaxis protein
VLAELKAHALARAIPVVLYTVAGVEQHICHLDVSDYLVKPLSESSLHQSVLRLAGPHAHILAIDDDPAVLKQIQTFLGNGHTWQVTIVDGGEAGIAAARQIQPDLILLDLLMPEVDGFAVLAALEAEPATSAIPVILLTSRDPTLSELLYLEQRVLSIISTSASQPRQLLNQITRARAI